MPFDPISLGLEAAPGLFKIATGLIQQNTPVKLTDTTPAAFKEKLALDRQRQGSAGLAGYGLLQNKLAQGQAATVQNARLGAGSGSDYLSAVAAADGNRMRGQLQLGAQNQQYQDRATQQLGQSLQQQAQYQQADVRAYNQAKAALTGSGMTNLFGGLSDVASAGAYEYANRNGSPNPTQDEYAANRLTPGYPSLRAPGYPSYAPPRTVSNPFPYGYPIR